jgi:hypothetical protein
LLQLRHRKFFLLEKKQQAQTSWVGEQSQEIYG